MSGRRGELKLDQQLEVGAMVDIARCNGTSWKALEEMFCTGRHQLRRYLATFKMHHQSSKMHHHGACEGSRRVEG